MIRSYFLGVENYDDEYMEKRKVDKRIKIDGRYNKKDLIKKRKRIERKKGILDEGIRKG
jgi:hypothetical protein